MVGQWVHFRGFCAGDCAGRAGAASAGWSVHTVERLRCRISFDPRYQDIRAIAILEITDDDETRVRVICGEFWGKRAYL